jgi:hypothetical protein
MLVPGAASGLTLKTMLIGLASNKKIHFGRYSGLADWANELHPYPEGFGELAGKFLSVLRTKFPGLRSPRSNESAVKNG